MAPGGGAAVGVRVMALPIRRTLWLWHARREGEAAGGGSLLQRAEAWGRGQVDRFREAERERPESVKARAYRTLVWAQARLDAREFFLSSLPEDDRPLKVLYPASLPERGVRRRMRVVARRYDEHRRCFLIWGGVTTLMLPTLLLPITNLPLYWAVYRLYCNWKAMLGSQALHRRLDAFQASGAEGSGVRFAKCHFLDEALRKGSPPDDSIIKVIADHYDLPNLTSQFQQVKYQMKQEDKMQEGAPKAAAAKAAAEA